MTSRQGRIVALDVLRGLTVALMIMVNNAGPSLGFMHHSEWNGLTVSDVVFPFFIFIMGASVPLSRSKSLEHVIRRVGLLILVCYGIYWIGYALKGDFLPFDHFRLTGVLVRIALTYGIVAVLALYVKHEWLPYVALTLLVGYSVLLLLGNGYSNDSTNVIARIDTAILGRSHLYAKRPIDPEGIIGLVSSVAHGIIGLMCGRILLSDDDNLRKIKKMAAMGGFLLIAGACLARFLPVNKRIWSPSFVLLTSGMAEMSLSLLLWAIDVKGRTGIVCRFFKVFGMNALATYAFSELLADVFGATGVAAAGQSLLGPAYCVAFMLLCFLFSFALQACKSSPARAGCRSSSR